MGTGDGEDGPVAAIVFDGFSPNRSRSPSLSSTPLWYAMYAAPEPMKNKKASTATAIGQ
jgi:hypothetical protein